MDEIISLLFSLQALTAGNISFRNYPSNCGNCTRLNNTFSSISEIFGYINAVVTDMINYLEYNQHSSPSLEYIIRDINIIDYITHSHLRQHEDYIDIDDIMSQLIETLQSSNSN